MEGIDHIEQVYTRAAKNYAQLLPDMRYEAELDLHILTNFISALLPGQRCLDAGCGAGRLYPLIYDAGVNYTGCDLSPGMISQAHHQYPGGSFTVADIGSLPYGAESFSALISWYSIIHVPQTKLPQVFSEFYRVLAPGGRALLAFQEGTETRTIKDAYGTGLSLGAQLHSANQLAQLLRQTGFQVSALHTREAREQEPHPQSFIVANKPELHQ